MANIRKTHNTDFKMKVAVETIHQQKSINELTSKYGVHATQINHKLGSFFKSIS